MMGLSRSSAKERGVTIHIKRITSAKIAFFIADSGVLAMLARVMKMKEMIFSGRVLPEQFQSSVGAPWYPS
jgi:hypothetical protein